MFIIDWLSLLKMGMSGEEAYGLFGLHHGGSCGGSHGGADPPPSFWIYVAVIVAGCVTQTL